MTGAPLAAAVAFAAVPLLASCSDAPPPYGPYWSTSAVAPVFTAKQNSLSTSFTGHVAPTTHFVYGAEGGFTLDKPNARLTVNANTVWQYAPIVVALYNGPREAVGTSEALVAHWDVPMAPQGGTIAFVNSKPLARQPTWAVVDLASFSGICILEILGHD